MDRPGSRKFGMVMCFDPPDFLSIKFYAFKNSSWGQLPSGKYKKHDIAKIICTYFSRILVC